MNKKLTLRECVLVVALVAMTALAFDVFAQPAPVDRSQGATIESQGTQANVINWNTIILAFFSMLTTVATTIGGIYLVKIRTGQETLEKVTNDTHTLVNSNMGVQLKITALTSARVAQLTGHPDDIAAAEIAKLAYDEHAKKQAMVDRGDAAMQAKRGGA